MAMSPPFRQGAVVEPFPVRGAAGFRGDPGAGECFEAFAEHCGDGSGVCPCADGPTPGRVDGEAHDEAVEATDVDAFGRIVRPEADGEVQPITV